MSVFIQAPPGAAAIPPSGTTDAQGQFAVTIWLGRAAGQYRYSASAGGANTAFTATAAAPAAGTIFSEVNAAHVLGNSGVSGPGALAMRGSIRGVAIDADGTVYLSDFDNAAVMALSPEGVLTLAAAGQAAACGSGSLGRPGRLAIDRSGHGLFILDACEVVHRLDLRNGSVTRAAGGGTLSDDDVPATAVAFVAPTHISIGPDRALYVAETTRIRRVDPQSGIISTWAGHAGGCSAGSPPDDLARCYLGQGSIVWDGAGNAFLTGSTCGGEIGILRRSSSGAMTRIAGIRRGATGDGGQALLSDVEQSIAPPSSLATDPAGNLYFAMASAIRRIEGTTGRLTTIAGEPRTAGSIGDGGPAKAALLAGQYLDLQVAFDGNLNLHVADSQNGSVRVIEGAGSSTPAVATLSVAAGDAQTLYVDQAGDPFSARLLDGAGQPLSPFQLSWSVLTPGGALDQAASRTDASGTASSLPRPGLAPGDYSFAASLEDIHGKPLASQTASFTLTARAPPPGTTFTAVNVGATGFAPLPGPGTIARTGQLWGLAIASDGTAYVSDWYSCVIYKLSPSGFMSVVAGVPAEVAGNCVGSSGNGGPATMARLQVARSLALDEVRQRLYIASGYQDSTVRVIDLSTGIIDLFAGSGAVDSDGVPATSVSLAAPGGLSVAPDSSVYLVDGGTLGRVRRIDGATGIITTVVSPCNSFASTVSVNPNGGNTAVDAAGRLYYFGFPSCDKAYPVLWKRSPGGAATIVAGSSALDSYGENIPATAATLNAPVYLATDAGGNLFVTDGGRHQVRQVDAVTGLIRTVAGNLDGTPGTSGDYLPASQTALRYPGGIGVSAAGHLFIAEHENYGLRVVW